jgi:hypothetical protein
MNNPFSHLAPPDGGFERLLVKRQRRRARANVAMLVLALATLSVTTSALLPAHPKIDVEAVRTAVLAIPETSFSVDGKPVRATETVEHGVRVYWIGE